MKKNKILDNIFKNLFLLCALISVLSVIAITFFIFKSGLPAIKEIGIFKFIFGKVWSPSNDTYGIFPMVLSSILVTLGAITLGVPIGLFTAIFMSKVSPSWLLKIYRPAIELLAGIPSVMYGFFGVIVILPMVQNTFDLPMGQSMFSAIIILTAMILPTVITISEVAINQVPLSYEEASLALGASKIQTIFKSIIPAAKSGILSAVILGTGRAVGETMAVILVAGNSPYMPEGIFSSIRTLTGNIAIEMGYAFGLHREALFATGIVLFAFIMVLNAVLMYIVKKGNKTYE